MDKNTTDVTLLRNFKIQYFLRLGLSFILIIFKKLLQKVSISLHHACYIIIMNL